MTMVVSILIFLIILTVIVLIHEAGHFITAKRFGVYCKEFAIGMGPVIWKKQKGETQYSIRALPMGGFVQMIGEDGEMLQLQENDQVWLKCHSTGVIEQISYRAQDGFEAVEIIEFRKATEPMVLRYRQDGETHERQTNNLLTCYDEKGEEHELVAQSRQFSFLKPTRKIIVLIAGIVLNFVLGFVLVIGVAGISGVETTATIATDVSQSGDGFVRGDTVIQINQEMINNAAELKAYVRAHPNMSATVIVERNNQQITLKRELKSAEGQKLTADGVTNETYGVLGVTYERNHTNIVKILQEAFKRFVGFFEYVYFVLMGLFTGKIPVTNLTGFIGIAQQTNAVVSGSQTGGSWVDNVSNITASVLNFAAFLSINIGVMNLLPFPALDGGRIVFALYELITRRKPNPKFETYVNTIGFILLILLFVFVTIMDLGRSFGG